MNNKTKKEFAYGVIDEWVDGDMDGDGKIAIWSPPPGRGAAIAIENGRNHLVERVTDETVTNIVTGPRWLGRKLVESISKKFGRRKHEE